MKIDKIRVYKVRLPLKEGAYEMSEGKKFTWLESTIVEVVTDAGIVGYGEACPLTPNYLPGYAGGISPGIKELAPYLIGADPLELGKLNERMDYILKGHPYVKTAIDIACWDILGKFTKLPLCTLLGGRFGDSIKLYHTEGLGDLATLKSACIKSKAEGYETFQVKLGAGDIDEDIERVKLARQILDDGQQIMADPNTAWLPHQALRLANEVKDLKNVYIEQPCATYAECVCVRQHTNLPMILDELMDSLPALMQACSDHAMDVVNLKIGRIGGLTKARQARDMCVTNGIAMVFEDTWGSDIAQGTLAHLAHSTPEKFRFAALEYTTKLAVKTAHGAPSVVNGKMQASDKPGIGIEPIMDVLGSPVAEY